MCMLANCLLYFFKNGRFISVENLAKLGYAKEEAQNAISKLEKSEGEDRIELIDTINGRAIYGMSSKLNMEEIDKCVHYTKSLKVAVSLLEFWSINVREKNYKYSKLVYQLSQLKKENPDEYRKENQLLQLIQDSLDNEFSYFTGEESITRIVSNKSRAKSQAQAKETSNVALNDSIKEVKVKAVKAVKEVKVVEPTQDIKASTNTPATIKTDKKGYKLTVYTDSAFGKSIVNMQEALKNGDLEGLAKAFDMEGSRRELEDKYIKKDQEEEALRKMEAKK